MPPPTHDMSTSSPPTALASSADASKHASAVGDRSSGLPLRLAVATSSDEARGVCAPGGSVEAALVGTTFSAMKTVRTPRLSRAADGENAKRRVGRKGRKGDHSGRATRLGTGDIRGLAGLLPFSSTRLAAVEPPLAYFTVYRGYPPSRFGSLTCRASDPFSCGIAVSATLGSTARTPKSIISYCYTSSLSATTWEAHSRLPVAALSKQETRSFRGGGLRLFEPRGLELERHCDIVVPSHSGTGHCYAESASLTGHARVFRPRATMRFTGVTLSHPRAHS